MTYKFYICTCTINIIIWLVIGFSCYFAGYVPVAQLNFSLRPVISYIANHSAVTKSCSYTCNCSSCGKRCNQCETCYYICYDHFLSFIYTPDPNIVKLNATQYIQLYMFTDKQITWDDPISDEDVSDCEKHVSMIYLVLEYYDSVDFLNTSYAAVAFVGFGVIVLMFVGMYWLVSYGKCYKLANGFV